MVDDVDRAEVNEQIRREEGIAMARARATIPDGDPGECEYCDEFSVRLVKKACARCRDRYKLG